MLSVLLLRYGLVVKPCGKWQDIAAQLLNAGCHLCFSRMSSGTGLSASFFPFALGSLSILALGRVGGSRAVVL